MPLKVSDGMGAWIDDFKKSDAPQFKGKSDKERRDQAIAAYLSAKRGGKPQSESVTSADDKEIVKTEAKRVVHSDRPDSLKSLRVMHPKPASEKPPFEGPYRKAGEVKKDRFGNVVKNRAKHLARMAARSNKEDVSELVMKTDPKIPNLKSPRDKKYRYQKPLSTYKQAKKSGEIRKEQQVKEETNFQVNIEGLPMMFMSGMGQGEIMQKLRKIVKQPSMIQSVKRVTDADVKKTFRLKAQGRDDEEEQMDEAKLDELSPATMNRYKTAAADDLHKSFNKGISVISKPKTKKDRAALDKRMDKRKAGLNRAARITGTHGQQDESK